MGEKWRKEFSSLVLRYGYFVGYNNNCFVVYNNNKTTVFFLKFMDRILLLVEEIMNFMGDFKI